MARYITEQGKLRLLLISTSFGAIAYFLVTPVLIEHIDRTTKGWDGFGLTLQVVGVMYGLIATSVITAIILWTKVIRSRNNLPKWKELYLATSAILALSPFVHYVLSLWIHKM